MSTAFLVDPPDTAYDLRFQVWRIPVRVHPLFWLVALLLGGSTDPKWVVSWVLAVFISILIHEMGHALAFRLYGMQARVLLYGMGGLTSSYGRVPSWSAEVFIAAAGPVAGFALAGVVFGLAGSTADAAQGLGPHSMWPIFVHQMLFVNVFWGIVNLFPVYPLDGGQIARAVLTRISPWRGLRASLVVSMLAAGFLAAAGLWGGLPFVALFFALLGYGSYLQLQGGGYSRPW